MSTLEVFESREVPISVKTWNILEPAYGEKYAESYHKGAPLSMQSRSKSLREKIFGDGEDIILLQEVNFAWFRNKVPGFRQTEDITLFDPDVHESIITGCVSDSMYDFLLVRKLSNTKEPFLTDLDSKEVVFKSDCVVVLWRRDVFNVDFNQLSAFHGDDMVAAAAKLEFVCPKMRIMHPAILACSVHLNGKPDKPDIAKKQLAHIRDTLFQQSSSVFCPAIILGGDFNAGPHCRSSVIDDVLDPDMFVGCLQSNSPEQQATFWRESGPKQILDNIFVTKPFKSTVTQAMVESHRELLRSGPFPNVRVPSDHLPLICQLTLQPRFYKTQLQGLGAVSDNDESESDDEEPERKRRKSSN